MSWQASIAAARKMYDWSGVTLGPSTGTVFVRLAVEAGVAFNKVEICSSETGNNFETVGAEDKSTTPRCTSMDGKTLSEKTGTFVVIGMGKGGGDFDPKRTTIA